MVCPITQGDHNESLADTGHQQMAAKHPGSIQITHLSFTY